MARVLILGDCHGQIDMFYRTIDAARAATPVDAVIQVGDFGFRRDIHRAFRKGFDLPIYVIDGNHDNHEWLRNASGCSRWPKVYNLTYMPRGSVQAIGGVIFGFLGGALNANEAQKGYPYQNYVTGPDVCRAWDAFAPWPPQVIITHSCPHSIGIGMQGNPQLAPWVQRFCRDQGFDAGPDDDCGEPGLRDLWQALDRRPRHWLFGHFHVLHQRRVEEVEFTCVGTCDRFPRAVVVYDTEARCTELVLLNAAGNPTLTP